MGKLYAKEKLYKEHGVTHDRHGNEIEFQYFPKPTGKQPLLEVKFADDGQLKKIVDLAFYAKNMNDIHDVASNIATISGACSRSKLRNLQDFVHKISGLSSETTKFTKPGTKNGANYAGLTLASPLKDNPIPSNDLQCKNLVENYFTATRLDEYKAVGKDVYDEAIEITHTVDESLRVADAISEFCSRALASGGDKTNAYVGLCINFDLVDLEAWLS
jgi:hypothetical protein